VAVTCILALDQSIQYADTRISLRCNGMRPDSCAYRVPRTQQDIRAATCSDGFRRPFRCLPTAELRSVDQRQCPTCQLVGVHSGVTLRSISRASPDDCSSTSREHPILVSGRAPKSADHRTATACRRRRIGSTIVTKHSMLRPVAAASDRALEPRRAPVWVHERCWPPGPEQN
jgi:hypothetical protein